MDILIKRAKIVDGTGELCYQGDIGIKDDKIVEIGTINKEAKKIIDAGGRIVCPGFIDIHGHADLQILRDKTGQIKLRQGVTTEFIGNCGFSVAPLSVQYEKLLRDYCSPVMGDYQGSFQWKSYEEYVQYLKQQSLSHNIGLLVGNGTLRIAVKGFENGPLSDEEMSLVKKHLANALEAGAVGLSIGLMYSPENYYTTEELIEICKIVNKYDGILVTHIRGEGNSLIKSIKEVIQIAKESDVPLHISHLKAAGKNNWQVALDQVFEIIETERASGLDITFDAYPYNAGSTTIASLLPPSVTVGGIDKAIQRMNDKETREKIVKELKEDADTWDNIVYQTGWQSVLISSVKSEKNKKIIGKTIQELAIEYNKEPEDIVIDLVIQEQGNVGIVIFHMSEDDVKRVIKSKYSVIISDSLYDISGNPHPRLYNSFPKILCKYVKEEKLLSLEEAIKKMTYSPAKLFGVDRRGKIEVGYYADICIIDMDRLKDNSDYINPAKYPEGIDVVIVNGKVAIEKGDLLSDYKGYLQLKN